MRLADITKGQEVFVTRGYSTRPAVVEEVRLDEKRVGVRFTDLDGVDTKRIPDGHRGGLFGATVRPNAVSLTR